MRFWGKRRLMDGLAGAGSGMEGIFQINFYPARCRDLLAL
jgi:hypothetical protein